jgi:NADH-quinone oxidoreductase subunit N
MNHDLITRLLDPQAILAIAPILSLTAGVVLLLLIDVLPGLALLRRPVFLIAIAFAAAFEARSLQAAPYLAFEGSFAAGPIPAAWGLLFLASALVAWSFAQKYYREESAFQVEHDVLMLSSTMGMMLMAGAQDLLVFFIGLELLSVPLYTLGAFRRARSESVEAGLKYFVLGAFAAAIYLFGAALLYAGTGSISLVELRAIGANGPLALTGVALLAASLFFKISVFPFHLWVPDVYQGSPTPVTALMATGTKAAGFAFLLNASFLMPRSAAPMVAVIAVLTMAAGNFGALMQNDVKRMLAYSGVAHAGTLLLAVAGFLAGDPEKNGAVHAALYYMAAYVFTAGGAFGLVAWLESEGKTVTIDSMRGLARRRPGVAAAMALFLLSLGGIPATGGFLGKYLVFSVAVRADMIAVSVIGVLLSVVALGYYLRVVVAMYMQPSEDEVEPALQSRLGSLLAAFACAAMVLVLGVLPGWFLGRLG